MTAQEETCQSWAADSRAAAGLAEGAATPLAAPALGGGLQKALCAPTLFPGVACQEAATEEFQRQRWAWRLPPPPPQGLWAFFLLINIYPCLECEDVTVGWGVITLKQKKVQLTWLQQRLSAAAEPVEKTALPAGTPLYPEPQPTPWPSHRA